VSQKTPHCNYYTPASLRGTKWRSNLVFCGIEIASLRSQWHYFNPSLRGT